PWHSPAAAPPSTLPALHCPAAPTPPETAARPGTDFPWRGARGAALRRSCGAGAVPRRSGGLGDRPVDPAHQAAQLGADDLDRVLGVLLAQALELGVAVLDVGHQAAGELARLDVGQDLLHPLLRAGVDHAR